MDTVSTPSNEEPKIGQELYRKQPLVWRGFLLGMYVLLSEPNMYIKVIVR